MPTSESYQPRHGAPDGAIDSEDEYEPQHSVGSATENDPMSSEERQAIVEDERNRHTDRELLGGSRAVAAAITENGIKALHGLLRAEAAVVNGVSSPRRGFHNFLVSRAEKKVAKRERKLTRAYDGLYKEHLQGSLDKAQQKLSKRTTKRDKVAGYATSRVEHAKSYRSSEHQAFINHLMEKKGAAVLRKETRHRLREQGAGRLKSRSLSKEIVGSENAKRAIELALVARASSRDYDADTASVRYHKQKYESTVKKIQTAESKYNEASHNLQRTNREIAELEARLPEARQDLEAVTAELRDVDQYDPQRIDIETRYAAAGRTYHRYEDEIRNKQLDADNYRRQMDKNITRFSKHAESSWTHNENHRAANRSERQSGERYRRVSDAANDELDELMNPVRTPDSTPDTSSENQPNETEE